MITNDHIINSWKEKGWSNKEIVSFCKEKGWEIHCNLKQIKKRNRIKLLSDKTITIRPTPRVYTYLREVIGIGKINKFINKHLSKIFQDENSSETIELENNKEVE